MFYLSIIVLLVKSFILQVTTDTYWGLHLQHLHSQVSLYYLPFWGIIWNITFPFVICEKNISFNNGLFLILLFCFKYTSNLVNLYIFVSISLQFWVIKCWNYIKNSKNIEAHLYSCNGSIILITLTGQLW